MEVAVCEDSLRNGSICGGGVCWDSDPMTRQQFMRITDYCQIKEAVEWIPDWLRLDSDDHRDESWFRTGGRGGVPSGSAITSIKIETGYSAVWTNVLDSRWKTWCDSLRVKSSQTKLEMPPISRAIANAASLSFDDRVLMTQVPHRLIQILFAFSKKKKKDWKLNRKSLEFFYYRRTRHEHFAVFPCMLYTSHLTISRPLFFKTGAGNHKMITLASG